MFDPDPDKYNVNKPTTLLIERVVVDDWMSVSNSVTQRELAEVSFKQEISRKLG